MPDAARRLFVYGSLGPGAPNHHVLAGIRGTWTRGTVRGRLHDRGWGAGRGFPGLVLDDAADPVPGHVFSSAELGDHWGRLDAFEGEEYERVRTTVRVEDGALLDAQVYVLRAP